MIYDDVLLVALARSRSSFASWIVTLLCVPGSIDVSTIITYSVRVACHCRSITHWQLTLKNRSPAPAYRLRRACADHHSLSLSPIISYSDWKMYGRWYRKGISRRLLGIQMDYYFFDTQGTAIKSIFQVQVDSCSKYIVRIPFGRKTMTVVQTLKVHICFPESRSVYIYYCSDEPQSRGVAASSTCTRARSTTKSADIFPHGRRSALRASKLSFYERSLDNDLRVSLTKSWLEAAGSGQTAQRRYTLGYKHCSPHRDTNCSYGAAADATAVGWNK